MAKIKKERLVKILREINDDTDIDKLANDLNVSIKTIRTIMKGTNRPEVTEELTLDELIKMDYYYSKFFLRSHVSENKLFEAYDLFLTIGKMNPIAQFLGIDWRRVSSILTGIEYPYIYNKLSKSKQELMKDLVNEARYKTRQKKEVI